MEPFECSKCDHWCGEEGIIYRRNGRKLYRCSTCRHETTLVDAPQEQE